MVNMTGSMTERLFCRSSARIVCAALLALTFSTTRFAASADPPKGGGGSTNPAPAAPIGAPKSDLSASASESDPSAESNATSDRPADAKITTAPALAPQKSAPNEEDNTSTLARIVGYSSATTDVVDPSDAARADLYFRRGAYEEAAQACRAVIVNYDRDTGEYGAPPIWIEQRLVASYLWMRSPTQARDSAQTSLNANSNDGILHKMRAIADLTLALGVPPKTLSPAAALAGGRADFGPAALLTWFGGTIPRLISRPHTGETFSTFNERREYLSQAASDFALAANATGDPTDWALGAMAHYALGEDSQAQLEDWVRVRAAEERSSAMSTFVSGLDPAFVAAMEMRH